MTRASDRTPLIGLLLATAHASGREAFRGAMAYSAGRKGERWRFHLDFVAPATPLEKSPAWDGCVAMAMTPALARGLRRMKAAAVNISGVLADSGLPTVQPDHCAIGRLAAQHLLDRGLTCLGLVGCQGRWYGRERLAGFQAEARRLGREVRVFDVAQHNGGEGGTQRMLTALHGWLAEMPRPAGVFATTDNEARWVAQTCWQLGRRVPDDVAIVGVDNDELLCESATPPLTSVDPNWMRVGFEAAALLDRLLRGQSPPRGKVLVAPKGVVVRQSTEMLAVADPDLAAALRYIRLHACDPCKVADVLRAVPVARRRLERRFAEVLARTPWEEITRVRLERACELLGRTSLSVDEVAQKTGYRHVQSFAGLFRRIMGLTPGAYRRARHSR